MRTLCLAVALAAAAPQAQTPVRDLRNPSPPQAGTGVIRGMVVADATGGAIRLAHVVAIGALTGTLRVTTTDTEGRFTIGALPGDRYQVAASKLPYLGAIAGARRPARPGTPVVVSAGQTVEGVSIRLPLGAAISGTIIDERGRPGAGITVGLQQWRNLGAERELVTARTPLVQTDERGRYRFYGLPPGEYVVVAMSMEFRDAGRQLSVAEVDAALKGTPVVPKPTAPTQVAPVYFPGTARSADAAPLVVNAGDDRQGVDFRLEFVRPSRIAGVVATSAGVAPTGTAVELSLRGSALSRTMSIRVGPDGVFGVSGMTPGTYLAIARGSGPLTAQFAATTIEVAGDDVARVTLTMRPALTLNGRLVFDGASPPALAGRRIPVQALTLNAATVTPSATDAAGAFSIATLLPGRYVLGGPLFFGAASTDSVTWTLQSVVADGRDITDLPLEITDSVPKDVVVTYGDRWQELSGRLTSASGAPAPGYTVIVFPANREYWLPGTRRIVTARPGTNGEFALSGPGLATLPAGEYLLAAVTDIDRNEQYDPAFLATLVSAAVPVTLTPGGRTVQDLRIR
ncbi:MAG TPA: carboxypeptidase-like regulatory domain-containing protein [Vicinamibacterales bacterium]|nr:carboxypeptidase-like regulatory domain-containing protein [Vicinamibacterales bacterium]